MKLICTFLFIITSLLLHAQSERYLKISGGRVSFGTGDVPGYGIYTEYSFRLGKQKQSYWKHFQLGGELGFETGARKYIVLIPPQTDYKKATFHTSDFSMHIKLSYYPFGTTFLQGLHVAIEPTGGYYFYSSKFRKEDVPQFSGLQLQSSFKPYNNTFIGYKISVGYEYYFKRLVIGARLDWSNNQKGDVNTMYGAKFGWKL